MDFVFDRIASGRSLKCLLIVDDATHEPAAIVPERTIGGDHLTRILDSVCSRRGKPAVIHTGNDAEFTGKAMLTWAHRIHGSDASRDNGLSKRAWRFSCITRWTQRWLGIFLK